MDEKPGCPLRLDCSVDVSRKDIQKTQLLKVLHHLRPSWKENDLIYQDLTGGFVNLILKCYIEKNPDDCIVLRIWLKGSDNLTDRDMEVKLQMILGKKGIAPNILATFKNGICCECFDGQSLLPSLCKTDEVARKIAKNLAKVHGIHLEGFKQRHVPFEIFQRGLEVYPPQHPDPEKNQRLQQKFRPKKEIAKEIKFLVDYVKDLQLTVVQCHGDLHSNNMMQDKTGKIAFLDYEMSHIGYAVEDISYFLLSLSIDYDNLCESLVRLSMPAKDYQRKFLRWYLEEWFTETGKDPKDLTEKDIQRLFIQVNRYYLIARFYGSMANVLSATMDKGDFNEQMKTMDFYEMAIENFRNYYATKKNLLL